MGPITLPTIEVEASSSFETLNQESSLIPQKQKVRPTRTSPLRKLSRKLLMPVADSGYPVGANGVRVGGLNQDDTQVSTLGIPLSLPQGGGADLSLFPSFLWSEINIRSTPTTGGFSASSSSGSVELQLWTRDQVLRQKRPEFDSRVTASWDRQVQTLSVATQKPGIAINAGMNLGLQEGPAGSLSYEFLRTPRSHARLHLLGSEQKGASLGSKSSPTPLATRDYFRWMPVVEVELRAEQNSALRLTGFADVSGIQFKNPQSTTSNTRSRTEQYGLETAWSLPAQSFQQTTIQASARFQRFRLDSATATHVSAADEFPWLAGITTEWFDWNLKSNLQIQGNNRIGLAPGGRVGWSQKSDNATSNLEFYTTGRLPTIQDRYYLLPGIYQGNPNLKPERVYALVFQRLQNPGTLRHRLEAKLEGRNGVVVPTGNSLTNDGTAALGAVENEWALQITPSFTAQAAALVTASRVFKRGAPYPSLPLLSARGSFEYQFSDELKAEWTHRYQGPSVAFDRSFHVPYYLMDLEIDFALSRQLQLQLALEDLLDVRAEIVQGFQQPGRMAILSLQASL